MTKKIGIIDADLLENGTRHPNLALMKISGFLKARGDDVALLESYENLDEYERVYISQVFSFSHLPDHVKKMKNVRLGGTGFLPGGIKKLPYEIEHKMPDYSLYDIYIKNKVDNGINKKKFFDYQNFSIGFTTRGCFRHCDFCVNKNSNIVVAHSKVNEFLDEKRFGIYLWDDNFLGFDGWENIIHQLEETGKPFQFRQGLDIRLLTEKKAKVLTRVKYYRDYIFAFDNIKDAPIIEKRLELWRKYTLKNTKLFVLCGYHSHDISDIINTFERIKILMKYSCIPYIMRYESYKYSPFKSIYVQLARWCNQPQFYKKMSFRQYCVANQDYELKTHKNSGGSSAYYSMRDFEHNYPEIAKEYFDLRFENESRFGNTVK